VAVVPLGALGVAALVGLADGDLHHLLVAAVVHLDRLRDHADEATAALHAAARVVHALAVPAALAQPARDVGAGRDTLPVPAELAVPTLQHVARVGDADLPGHPAALARRAAELQAAPAGAVRAYLALGAGHVGARIDAGAVHAELIGQTE